MPASWDAQGLLGAQGTPLHPGSQGKHTREALFFLAFVSEPGKNWIFMKRMICCAHMAIEGVLTRQKCAETWCANLWAPGLQLSVSPNRQILNFQVFDGAIGQGTYENWGGSVNLVRGWVG